MREEIKNAYGKDVGKFYKRALRTTRSTTVNPELRRSAIRANYPKGSAGYRSLQSTATPAQKQTAERQLRKVQKDAASRYTRKTTAEKAAKAASRAAKLSRAAKVTPAGLVAGVALDKGSKYARKKFVEADMRKVAKLKREASNIDKAMAAARKRKKGK